MGRNSQVNVQNLLQEILDRTNNLKNERFISSVFKDKNSIKQTLAATQIRKPNEHNKNI